MGEQNSASLAFFNDVIDEAGFSEIASEVFSFQDGTNGDSNQLLMGGESSSQGGFGESGSLAMSYAARTPRHRQRARGRIARSCHTRRAP